MKLTTTVEFPGSGVKVSCGDRIMSLGSCFADNIGGKLLERGFDICMNPFGTLYNPRSIADSVARLDSGEHFTERDCVRMGSGSAKWCSFHHHTLAAKDSPEEFLAAANEALDRASAFWKSCGKVLVTLGTSWCYRFVGGPESFSTGAGVGCGCRDEIDGGGIGKGCRDGAEDGGVEGRRGADGGFVVANCLKRDAKEFVREFISAAETADIIGNIVRSHPDKQFIFTVSPIRHFKDGAHGNQLSKANLLTGLDAALRNISGTRCAYFPAYEIMLDELRDYRFYAEDMIHPSAQAVNYIFERFVEWALPADETEEFRRRDKAFRQSKHISR